MMPEVVARFGAKVDKAGPILPASSHLGACWVWTASKTSMGYGYVRIATRPFVAHRVSWEIHNGPIRDGLWVLHRCDNPPCVNPDHLRLGTPGENNADCRAKGRHRGPVIEEGTR